MLSTSSKYAIKALISLSKVEAAKYQTVPNLAKLSDVPAPYLSKIMKVLSRKGIVESKKGLNGGIRLTKKAISFFQICEVLNDPIVFEHCFLSNSKCNMKNPCEFHSSWSKERTKILSYLKKNKIKRKKVDFLS